jgi:hypothetical protein
VAKKGRRLLCQLRPPAAMCAALPCRCHLRYFAWERRGREPTAAEEGIRVREKDWGEREGPGWEMRGRVREEERNRGIIASPPVRNTTR